MAWAMAMAQKYRIGLAKQSAVLIRVFLCIYRLLFFLKFSWSHEQSLSHSTRTAQAPQLLDS